MVERCMAYGLWTIDKQTKLFLCTHIHTRIHTLNNMRKHERGISRQPVFCHIPKHIHMLWFQYSPLFNRINMARPCGCTGNRVDVTGWTQHNPYDWGQSRSKGVIRKPKIRCGALARSVWKRPNCRSRNGKFEKIKDEWCNFRKFVNCTKVLNNQIQFKLPQT